MLPSFTFETKVNIGNLVSKNFFKNSCPHKTISSLLEIIALPFLNGELALNSSSHFLEKSCLNHL